MLTPKSLNTPNTTLAAKTGLTVVLVEPRIPQNTGNIGRLCVCAGADLYLVGSLGFRLNAKQVDRAGMDYLDHLQMKHVPDFESVLSEKPGYTPYYLSSKAKQGLYDVTFPPNSILVFGSETHGLPQAWLDANPETCLRIPMSPQGRSLNLANSVSIVLYEAIRQQLTGV
jgi:tRNA (cytidine/uridine-2'-O-)-methyltransferase